MLPLVWNGAKCEKKTRNAKKVTQNTPLYTFYFSHFMSIYTLFVFRISWAFIHFLFSAFREHFMLFYDKRIAGLTKSRCKLEIKPSGVFLFPGVPLHHRITLDSAAWWLRNQFLRRPLLWRRKNNQWRWITSVSRLLAHPAPITYRRNTCSPVSGREIGAKIFKNRFIHKFFMFSRIFMHSRSIIYVFDHHKWKGRW